MNNGRIDTHAANSHTGSLWRGQAKVTLKFGNARNQMLAIRV